MKKKQQEKIIIKIMKGSFKVMWMLTPFMWFSFALALHQAGHIVGYYIVGIWTILFTDHYYFKKAPRGY